MKHGSHIRELACFASVFFGTIPIAIAADPIQFCQVVLSQGLRDKDMLTFSTSSFLLNRNTICDSRYSQYSEAQSLNASGGIDIVGIFGISGGDAQASQKYSAAWSNYCSSSYANVQNSADLRTVGEHASAAVLNSFNHCLDVLGDRIVRYIEPTDQGSGFTIYIEKHIGGAQNISVSGIDMQDTNTGEFLSLQNCEHENSPLGKAKMPVTSGNSNQLAILCKKPKDHSIAVNVTSDAGNVPTVTVPASPPAPLPIYDRVQALETENGALKQKLDAVNNDLSKKVSDQQSSINSIQSDLALFYDKPTHSHELMCGIYRFSDNQPAIAAPLLIPLGRPDLCRAIAEGANTYSNGGFYFQTVCRMGANSVKVGAQNDDKLVSLPAECQ